MNELLHEQAVQWLIEVRDAPADAAVQRAFDAWLARGDAHRLAYLDALMAFNAGAESSEPLPAITSPRFVRRHPVWLGAGFAAVAVFALLFGPRWSEQLRADAASAPGVARELVLDDGTQLRLAPDSLVAIDFDAAGRDIELLRGAVTVDVAADPRPLTLRHRDATVRDIGTRFEVQTAPDVLRVSVASGLVEVTRAGHAALQVAAGEQVEWRGAAIAQRAWQERREVAGLLVLEQAPAALAMAQWAAFEGRRVQWIGAAPGHAGLDAALPMRTPEERQAALATLAREFAVDVLFDGPGIVILRALP